MTALLCHLLAGKGGQSLNKSVAVLTGWEVLAVSMLAEKGAAESRLSRARRWVFPALSGDRDWDLGMCDSDLEALCLPLAILPPRLLTGV